MLSFRPPKHMLATSVNDMLFIALQAFQGYLSSICSELQSYTITDVQTPDRVAVLLKDSYIESFQPRDRAFVRQFTETQMFSVYCDSVIR